MNETFDWIKLAGLILSIVAFGFSLYTLSYNTKKQREMKTIDLKKDYQKRYDELVWDIQSKVKNDNDALKWHERFWNLQLEQYEYWIQGFIDHDEYEYWMEFRRTSYRNKFNPFDDNSITISFEKGWEESVEKLKLHMHKKRFDDFMDKIFNSDQTTRDIFEKHKKNIRKAV